MPHSNTLDERVTRRRTRWLRLNRGLSAGVGLVAVTAAVYLGVTAPSASPVQSPAAAAAVAPAVPAAGTDTTGGGTDAAAADHRGHGDGGGDGAGPFGAAGFDGHHR